ncbi:integrase [Histophilus somni]|uniref:integrase n=1 Tax=Histophilus somni TaxID=731 RepID=UPI0018EDFDEB|nr:integrase [Histophilus somni]QQF90587.1 integrase [Histophilus somni]
MNNLIFTPKDNNPKSNLEQFINFSKNQLTIFGNDCWENNQWKTTFSIYPVQVRFSTERIKSTAYKYEPLAVPFIEFAKAYIRYTYSLNPIRNLARHIESLRIVEMALYNIKGKADILQLDYLVIHEVENIVSKKYKKGTKSVNKLGYQIQKLFDFCRENQITSRLPLWENPYKRPRDLTILLDEKGKEYRSSKMPTDEVMMLVAKLFHDAPNLDKETEYYTAVMALLMVAPSRCSELMSLSVNCLEWEEDSLGNKQLGIRWQPVKNGVAGLKWVPSSMQDVVIEAVNRLVNISKPARIAAKFAEEYPNKFMLAPSDNYYPNQILNEKQIGKLLGINGNNGINTKWFKSLLKENNGAITLDVLGKFVYQKYTSKFNHWPYIDKNKHVKASEALLLFRENEFHDDVIPKNFSFVLPTVNQINDRFCYSETRPKTSLWEKHCIGTQKGEFIKLPSHNARHWLSTKSERGGMDELTLANWAGRARVADNRAYDHRTEEEKSESVRNLLIPEDISILDKIHLNLPVTYEELGKDIIGIATVTEIGICEHDYAMSPRVRHGDCETCKELVCIKGLESSLEILKQRETQLTEQFNRAKEHHKMGTFGADRWVSSLGWRLTHIRTKIKFLENEQIPNGALFRVPDKYDPSPIKQTLLEKGMDINIAKPETAKLDDDLYRLMEL